VVPAELFDQALSVRPDHAPPPGERAIQHLHHQGTWQPPTRSVWQCAAISTRRPLTRGEATTALTCGTPQPARSPPHLPTPEAVPSTRSRSGQTTSSPPAMSTALAVTTVGGAGQNRPGCRSCEALTCGALVTPGSCPGSPADAIPVPGAGRRASRRSAVRPADPCWPARPRCSRTWVDLQIPVHARRAPAVADRAVPLGVPEIFEPVGISDTGRQFRLSGDQQLGGAGGSSWWPSSARANRARSSTVE